MNYVFHSFRYADVILREPELIEQYDELVFVLNSITDEEVIEKHLSYGADNEEKTPKSLSVAVNDIFKTKFANANWNAESKIFQDSNYEADTWRLDFAKKDISIEVAFNHSSVIAWNLIKPVIASELNHVQKAIQTKVGVVITATSEFKTTGGFDGAIGTYEKYLDYLPPLMNLLTTPILLIGITPFETFKIEHFQLKPRKKIGKIVYY